jgi:transposase-like protein
LKAIEFVLQINRFFTILVKSICQINLFFFLIEHVCGIKRVKRTLSPTTSTSIFINSNNDNSEHDDDDEYDDDEDDERDSSSNPTTMSPKSMLTCPSCDSTYHRLGHLLRHAKRKHRIDLSSYDGPHTFDMLTSQTNQLETSDIELNKDSKEQMHTEDMKPCEKSSQQPSKSNINSFFVLKKTNQIFFSDETIPSSVPDTNTTTDCPYCDYKTTDIEQFKSHIIAHIRDKNYRCLLCNRLYKYRGKIKHLFLFSFIYFSLL